MKTLLIGQCLELVLRFKKPSCTQFLRIPVGLSVEVRFWCRLAVAGAHCSQNATGKIEVVPHPFGTILKSSQSVQNAIACFCSWFLSGRIIW